MSEGETEEEELKGLFRDGKNMSLVGMIGDLKAREGKVCAYV